MKQSPVSKSSLWAGSLPRSTTGHAIRTYGAWRFACAWERTGPPDWLWNIAVRRRHCVRAGEGRVVKVFAMNDCDWVAAETLEAAKALYLKDYWGGSNDEGAFDDPRELSDDEMARLQFVDTDDDEKPTGRRSFREQLDKLIAAGQTFPCFFASTEY